MFGTNGKKESASVYWGNRSTAAGQILTVEVWECSLGTAHVTMVMKVDWESRAGQKHTWRAGCCLRCHILAKIETS
jgi:hypothetical protein